MDGKLKPAEWKVLLSHVLEAADRLTVDECKFAIAAIERNEIEVFDYGMHVDVRLGGRRLLTINRLLLSKPTKTVPSSN